MLQGEHSALLFGLIKLQFAMKLIVLSILEWPFYTSFTVYDFESLGVQKPNCVLSCEDPDKPCMHLQGDLGTCCQHVVEWVFLYCGS